MLAEQDFGRYLFHYTTAEAFVTHILPTRQLMMSTFANVNDPFESRKWTPSVNVESVEALDIFRFTATFNKHIKGAAKVLCFAQDHERYPGGPASRRDGRGFLHPSMWDRYSGRHTGVCLAFDVTELEQDIRKCQLEGERLIGDEITYRDGFADGLYLHLDDLDDDSVLDAMRAHQIEHAGSLYFTKASDWRTECEFRWVLLTPNAEMNSNRFVNVQRSLRGVILGDQFPTDAVSMIGREIEGQDISLARLLYMNGTTTVLPIQDTSAAAFSNAREVSDSLWGPIES